MWVDDEKGIIEIKKIEWAVCEKVKGQTLADVNITIEPLTKEQLEENIWKIHDIFNIERKKLNDLRVWINKEWEEREVLDSFLDFVWLEKIEWNRLWAYNRLSALRDDNLKITFGELKFSDEYFLSDYADRVQIGKV